ncbi:MAG: hypothetical protein ACRD45_18925, partial [Bryobacteraceae bacterium]
SWMLNELPAAEKGIESIHATTILRLLRVLLAAVYEHRRPSFRGIWGGLRRELRQSISGTVAVG